MVPLSILNIYVGIYHMLLNQGIDCSVSSEKPLEDIEILFQQMCINQCDQLDNETKKSSINVFSGRMTKKRAIPDAFRTESEEPLVKRRKVA